MDKRYQVFVSSTFTDLKNERREVIQALMELDCIPAGMELFPSADEEQFTFIKKVIDDCDYYVLIIGGRYGSTAPEGISYTEKEYEYAREKGLPVLAFVHEDPGKLTMEKSEVDPTSRTKLDAFRKKVINGKLVKLWSDPKILPGLVALSLARAIKAHPAVGWVRADQIATTQVLAELNEVRKENEEFQKKLNSTFPQFTNLAGLDSKAVISGTSRSSLYGEDHPWKLTTTWGDVFAAFSPYLLEGPTESDARNWFQKVVKKLRGTKDEYDFDVNNRDFQQAKIQFIALNLVRQTGQRTWELTDLGRDTLIQFRALREPAAPALKKKTK